MKKLSKFLNYKYSKLIISLIALVLLVVPFWIYKVNNDKKILSLENKDVFAHLNPDVIKDEVFGDLKMSNVTMITDNGYTTFTADVTNTGNDVLKFENINIELRNKEGNVIVVLLGNIGSDFKPNEIRTISAVAKGDFKNVFSKTLSVYEG